MQNTIIREFAGHPDVIAVIFDQGGSQAETYEWLEIFWSNYYLRGGVLFDEYGLVGMHDYGQPACGLPFGRGFIIDQEGRVSRPYFGHQPAQAIADIYALLGTTAVGEALPTGPPTGGGGRSPLLSLATGYPNPFRSAALVNFTLSRPAGVTLRIYAPWGACIRTVADSWRAAGPHRVAWDGSTATGRMAPAGVYFYRLEAEGQVASGKWVKIVPE